MATTTTFNEGLFAFLADAPTPFHAVSAMVSRLDAAGFIALDERAAWGALTAGKYYVTRNDSSLIALDLSAGDWVQQGLRLVGAHTDSPCLQVKPQPDKTNHAVWQLGVEVYGGALLNPWFDRDLSLAGRIAYADAQGQLQHQLINFSRPIAVIPSLAIHLDREANKNRTINPQTDLPPILAQLVGSSQADFRAELAAEAGLNSEQILDYELSFYDCQPAATVGLSGDFITSARLDNLLSCYAGLTALLSTDSPLPSGILYTDHEEVGSQSAAGADSHFARDVLQRLCGTAEDLPRMLARSILISADNAHAVHPNFAAKHDGEHGPKMNGGPVIKKNANQRYATNSETGALFRQLCAAVDVPVQDFVVRSDMGCGSTIGPMTASHLGVRTVDVGVPTLAMHSIRELAGSQDAEMLTKVLTEFNQTEF